MGKIIFMLLIAAITWMLFKKRIKPPSTPVDKTEGASESNTSSAGKKAKELGAAERMVACAACGVFMPESDSVIHNDIVSCRDPAHCAHRPHANRASNN